MCSFCQGHLELPWSVLQSHRGQTPQYQHGAPALCLPDAESPGLGVGASLWSSVSASVGTRPLPCLVTVGCEDPGDWREGAFIGTLTSSLAFMSLCIISLALRMCGTLEKGPSKAACEIAWSQ